MFDPDDPRMRQWEAERPYREQLYEAWCATHGLDPVDTASAIAYEQWQVENLPDDAVAQAWPELSG